MNQPDLLNVPTSYKYEVWNCGGGTQSCAIGALIIQGKLPKPDIAVIADTGREVRSTWDYLDNVLNPALSKFGVHVIRVKAEDWGYAGKSFVGSGELLPPVYTTENGSLGKMSNFCNRWWKQDVVQRWLSSQGITNKDVRKWIGFSFDEQRRYLRMMEGEEYKAGKIYLPLVELRLRRAQSIEVVLSMGWPPPPRSRCYMCPNQQDEEWLDLKENQPGEFLKAVHAQTEITAIDPNAWLHKSALPLEQVQFSRDEKTERACDSGLCMI